jgi:hypothetical protein
MYVKQKNIFFIAAVVILLNTFIWLDSVDTYLSAQYHLVLSEYFPDELFQPSIKLKKSIAGVYSNSDVDPVNGPSINTDNSNKPRLASPGIKPIQSTAPVLLDAQVRILFAGDSMMQGIAPVAISTLRKIQPEGYFEDLSKQSTGLTVNRYLDWPATIKEQITKKHFDSVVIFLGPNDPWDIVDGKERFKFPSPEWEDKYRSRVREVLDFASSNNVKIIWIGLPSMREDRLHKGAVIQNKIFKEEMNAYSFKFISTEDLLGSLDLPFKNYIYDSNGKEVVVRASDGTHFSPQGLRIISSKLVSVIVGPASK